MPFFPHWIKREVRAFSWLTWPAVNNPCSSMCPPWVVPHTVWQRQWKCIRANQVSNSHFHSVYHLPRCARATGLNLANKKHHFHKEYETDEKIKLSTNRQDRNRTKFSFMDPWYCKTYAKYMPSINANKKLHLWFSRGMHMTTQILNKLVINLCLDVWSTSCKMSTIWASTQELAAPVGSASPLYEGCSQRTWRSQLFSRFRAEITNFQNSPGGVVALRSIFLSDDFVTMTESLTCLPPSPRTPALPWKLQ